MKLDTESPVFQRTCAKIIGQAIRIGRGWNGLVRSNVAQATAGSGIVPPGGSQRRVRRIGVAPGWARRVTVRLAFAALASV